MATKLNHNEIIFTALITVAIGAASFSLGRASVGEIPSPTSSFSPGRREPRRSTDPSARLFAAIRQHESVNGTILSGDNGASLGEYHIGRDYWQDAIEYGRVDWGYSTYVWSAPHCRQVMLWYWSRYGARTLEDCARLHNGGSSMQGTDDYWQKIKAIMENIT